jgi:VIT1/CCC1 family predicted Fe2+/Mn2+ transporter
LTIAAMSVETNARRYLDNLQNELDSAMLYRALAKSETHAQLARVYNRLADTEESHAAFWENKLRMTGREPPARRAGWRARVLAALARRFGPECVLPVISTNERRDSHKYDGLAEARNTPLPGEEQSHARVLDAISRSDTGAFSGRMLADLEGRHRAAGGNALRAAVLGANDGLLSNLSLVMGVAGAEMSGAAILVTGLAGLLAGAGSMALGEWLSVQSSRELYQRQIAIETEELRDAPQDEQEELSLIYQAKGLPEPQARELAAKLIAQPATALDTLVREELGIDPKELGGSAWQAAITSFALFAIGAVVPVAPFALLSGSAAVAVSVAASALMLFAIGAGITLLTGRSVLYSGFRQVVFGLAAAALTYGVGRLIGVSLAG